MGIYEHWPYVNFHELNTNWLIEQIPKVFKSRDEAEAYAAAAQEAANESQQYAEEIEQKFNNIQDPDNYEGSDSQKLAAAINALSDGGIVIISRDYNLDADVLISRDSNHGRVIIRCVNKNALVNCNSFGFIGTEAACGGLLFEDVHFTGTGSLVDGQNLIRIGFNNCYFDSFTHLVYNSYVLDRRYLQSINFTGCVIRFISGNIIELPQIGAYYATLYDVHINNCLIEWCYGCVINGGFWQGVSVDYNTIEGFRDVENLFTMLLSTGTSISSNYFERNQGSIIDMSNITVGNVVNLDFENNTVIEDQKTTGSVIVLPKVQTQGVIRIEDNYVVLAPGTQGYAVSVPDEVNQTLSNVVVNAYVYTTVYDPNSRIPVKKELPQLYNDVLYKSEYITDVKPGSVTILETPVSGVAVSPTLLRFAVPFPFTATNSTYTVTISVLSVTNVGNLASDSSVNTKKPSGMYIDATGTFTEGQAYVGMLTVRIDF